MRSPTARGWRARRTRRAGRRSSISSTSASRCRSGWSTCPAMALPKRRRTWSGAGALVNDYLRGRAVLKRALVLVDSRHGLKDADREMMQMLDDAAVNYQLVLTKADKVKPSALARLYEATHDRGARSIPPRTRPSSRRRAKRVAASPSCGRQSSKPRRPEGASLVQADHRQSRLFELVDARLARLQAVGRRVRGAGRADVRRRMGQAARRRRVRAVARQGADPVGRRDRRVGQPGDHRVPRRPLMAARSIGPKTRARAASRARWPRKCTRASPTSAANCR